MLAISTKQFEELRTVGMEAFLRRALAALRSSFSDHPRIESDAEGLALLRAIAAFAAAHSISTERSVMRLALLELRLGPGFWTRPEYPWAMPVLEATDRGEESRLGLLEGYATEVQDGEAR